MIERLRVRIPAGAWPQSFCQKCRWQVTPKHTYTLDPSKSEWADYAAVQAECGNLSGNKLTRNSSRNTWSVVSTHWATVDWSWPIEWNKFVQANLHFKREKKAQAGNELLNILPKSSHARKKPPPLQPHYSDNISASSKFTKSKKRSFCLPEQRWR